MHSFAVKSDKKIPMKPTQINSAALKLPSNCSHGGSRYEAMLWKWWKRQRFKSDKTITCWAISGLGPSSRRRRANDAAVLKFLSLKKRLTAVLSVRIMWTGCMLQCVKYAAIYRHTNHSSALVIIHSDTANTELTLTYYAALFKVNE